MGAKQTIIVLILFALVIGYGWYRHLAVPSVATDLYPSWSRLMLLVPATVIWAIAAGIQLYRSIGVSKA